MNHFSTMGQLLDDATRVVDDLVAVECQLYSEYYPKLNAAVGLPPHLTPKLESIIPKKKTKTAKLPALPKQIPTATRRPKTKSLPAEPVQAKAKLPLKERAISPPLIPVASKALKREENPFLMDGIEDKEGDEDISIPLTIYSLYQFPLEATATSTPPQVIPELITENLDSDNDSSSNDDDSMGSSPPPPFMVFHSAAFKALESSVSVNLLAPEFKLLYSRDKLIATLEPEKAYFLKYVNELLSSRASMLNKNNSSFMNTEQDVTIRDLHDICMPLSTTDTAALREKRQIYNARYDNYSKGRDLRPNSYGWRALAAEFSMIYAKKIVRPLKPRAYLPRRTQEFFRVRSPLCN